MGDRVQVQSGCGHAFVAAGSPPNPPLQKGGLPEAPLFKGGLGGSGDWAGRSPERSTGFDHTRAVRGTAPVIYSFTRWLTDAVPLQKIGDRVGAVVKPGFFILSRFEGPKQVVETGFLDLSLRGAIAWEPETGFLNSYSQQAINIVEETRFLIWSITPVQRALIIYYSTNA